MAYISHAVAFRPEGLERPLRADHRSSPAKRDFKAYLRAAKPERDSSETPVDEPPPPDAPDADKLRPNTDQVITPVPSDGVPSLEFAEATPIPFIVPDAGGTPEDRPADGTAFPTSDTLAPTVVGISSSSIAVADPSSPIKPNLDAALPLEVESSAAPTAESKALAVPVTDVDREVPPGLAQTNTENRDTVGTKNPGSAYDEGKGPSAAIAQPDREIPSPTKQDKPTPTIHEAPKDRSTSNRPAIDVDAGSDGESVLDQKLAKAIEDAKTGTNGDGKDDRPSHRFGNERRAGGPPQTHAHSRVDSTVQGGAPALEVSALTSLPNSPGESGDRPAAALGRFLLGGGSESAGNIRDFTPIPVARPSGGEAPPPPTTGLTSPGTAAETLGQVMTAGGNSAEDPAGSIRLLSAANGSGQSRATLQLNPPELGRLTVQVRMQQQAMVLHVQADSAEVGRLIESRLGELRNALSVHGIRVERTDVVVRSDASADAHPQRQDGHTPTGGEQRDNSFATTSDESRDGYRHSGTPNDDGSEGSPRGGGEERGAFSEPRRSIEEIDFGAVPTAERSVDLVA